MSETCQLIWVHTVCNVWVPLSHMMLVNWSKTTCNWHYKFGDFFSATCTLAPVWYYLRCWSMTIMSLYPYLCSNNPLPDKLSYHILAAIQNQTLVKIWWPRNAKWKFKRAFYITFVLHQAPVINGPYDSLSVGRSRRVWLYTHFDSTVDDLLNTLLEIQIIGSFLSSQ